MARGLEESQQNPEITVNEMVMGHVEIDVTGGDNHTMTDEEFNHAIFNITGAITANLDIVVPDDSKIYFVTNNTTGSYSIAFTTELGSGSTITQGSSAILASDGTNVISFIN